MKGTAHIVVKDKYGNIKTNVTEHNTITDAFKNRVQAWLTGIEKYQTFDNKGRFPSTADGYFNGIFVNEATIADDKDIPIPVFIGGQVAKANALVLIKQFLTSPATAFHQLGTTAQFLTSPRLSVLRRVMF